MQAKVADLVATLPQDASLEAFFAALERHQRRMTMVGMSYKELLESAKEAGGKRAQLTYFVITATVGILTYYWASLVGRTDELSEVMRWVVPIAALAKCYIIMRMGLGRYTEECAYTARALKDEEAEGIVDGPAAIRARMLAFSSFWDPTRDHLASGCAAAIWIVALIVQAWQG